MTDSTNDDAWCEKALVSIAAQSGTDVKFQALTETIDPDFGEKGAESVALINGGRVMKHSPQGDATVTLECYPLQAGTVDLASNTTGGKGFFDLLHDLDTSQPLSIAVSHTRNKYRVAILWTTDTTVTNAASAITGSNIAQRYVFANAFVTNVKPSFTDGILKFTVTIKCAPFDKDGNAQILMESTDGTASMTALSSFTSTVKF